MINLTTSPLSSGNESVTVVTNVQVKLEMKRRIQTSLKLYLKMKLIVKLNPCYWLDMTCKEWNYQHIIHGEYGTIWFSDPWDLKIVSLHWSWVDIWNELHNEIVKDNICFFLWGLAYFSFCFDKPLHYQN